ncbi:50S ribosomal protein L24 [Patescibacteria group bacterium]|nr:50S ribosomal protein L24 [Patescibacteria group bacterium]
MLKLRKGDQVQVLLGKDKGKKGKIDRIFPDKGMVLINGLNLVKKHVKSQGEKKPGGIMEITKPLKASKVALVCPKCKKITRVGFRVVKDKTKHRICRKCGQVIGK